MSVLFGGGENEALDLIAGAMNSALTTKYRPAYARGCFAPVNPGGGGGAAFLLQHRFGGRLLAYLDAQPNGDKDFWYAYRWVGGGGFLSGQVGPQFYDSTGKAFLRGLSQGANDLVWESSPDGGTWTRYGASVLVQPNTPTQYALRIKIHPTLGFFAVWVEGSLWFQSPVGNTSGWCVGSPSKFLHGLPNSNGDCYVSEVMASSADDPCIGWNLHTLPLTAIGALAAWTGPVSAVNELQEDQSTVNSTAAAGTDVSYVPAALPSLAPGLMIRAIIWSGKFRTSGGAPQNNIGFLRIGATVYPAAMQLVDTVAALRQYIWESDPRDGTGLTPISESMVASTQPGNRSVA
jgi:hypothetical protein